MIIILKIALLIIFASIVINAIKKHGEPKPKDKYNGWMTSLSFLIWMLLLYYAGFFNNFFCN